ASGRVEEALTAFDRSARILERTTRNLPQDLDRVRFRDHQIAAFEGPIDLLLAEPASDSRVEALLAWSQRRKAAALALAVAGQSEPRQSMLSIEQLRHRIPRGSALLDFLTIRQRSAVLLVTTLSASVVALPLSPDSLTRLAEQLRGPMVQAYAGQIDLARAQFDSTAARQLYAALLGPLEERLTGVNRLLLVPDGALHYVPFDALVGPSGYLLDRFEIELVPSAQFLPPRLASWQRPSGTDRILVVAHDAPGAEQEARAIRQTWPAGTVRTFEGVNASEATVRSASASFRILHFATHAEADDREPAASHLRLAANAGADGFYHLGEIAADHRRAELVVLSACETESGPLYRGEGLMGLARAFLSGGAGQVVATEWPVGAATAELMREFHRRLAKGDEPGTALRQAKLSLRRNVATGHPFYWAGFVLLRGAPGPGPAGRSPSA
ncbi:MAG TPA: CHAT domain-containing protein, partial [Candidatus Dormibacteraeota bacterium]